MYLFFCRSSLPKKTQKCCVCQAYLSKTTRTKAVISQEEADSYSRAFDFDIRIGSIVCNACRIKYYKKIRPAEPLAVASLVQLTDSSPSTSSSQTSGGHSSEDPVLDSPAKKKKKKKKKN